MWPRRPRRCLQQRHPSWFAVWIQVRALLGGCAAWDPATEVEVSDVVFHECVDPHSWHLILVAQSGVGAGQFQRPWDELRSLCHRGSRLLG